MTPTNPRRIRLPIGKRIQITAAPLTRAIFLPFGDAFYNPNLHPAHQFPEPEESKLFPYGTPANQGTALRLSPVSSSLRDLTHLAPSASSNPQHDSLQPGQAPPAAETGPGGKPIMSLFVCNPPDTVSISPSEEQEDHDITMTFPVQNLERHPYTSQSFIPLSSAPGSTYLVIVAASLPLSDPTTPAQELYPVPPPRPVLSHDGVDISVVDGGVGLPDLSTLCAFVASSDQAITYAPGTWHAPMVVLPPATLTDTGNPPPLPPPFTFAVFQWTTGVYGEDCQELFFVGSDAPAYPGPLSQSEAVAEREQRDADMAVGGGRASGPTDGSEPDGLVAKTGALVVVGPKW